MSPAFLHHDIEIKDKDKLDLPKQNPTVQEDFQDWK